MITTSFYLDTRRHSNPEVPAPLKISIRWNGQTAYLSSGMKIPPVQWNAGTHSTKDQSTQLSLSRFKYRVDSLLAEMQENNELDGLTALGIKQLLEYRLSPNSKRRLRFIECMVEFASTRPQPRTREIYMATVDRIKAFDPKAESLYFEGITINWLERFDLFLAKTSPKKNARNIHLRNIRAVFNEALKQERTTYYPFRKFVITPEPTRKRNLSVEQLRTLFNAEVPAWQQKYIDFFKISFFLIGINTEDLLHATTISGGRLEYQRAKTHRPYSIKVEPECMELIEKYRGKEYLLNILDSYSKTCNWTSKVNNELQAICKTLGLPKISMYWARHSWSTFSSDLDIPQETIAAALGHSDTSVTGIYINFDRSKIDKANRQVMDYVLYDKKPEDVHKLIKQMSEDLARLRKESTK